MKVKRMMGGDQKRLQISVPWAGFESANLIFVHAVVFRVVTPTTSEYGVTSKRTTTWIFITMKTSNIAPNFRPSP